jgi:hybrid cluster-associated redox disulfide protein
LITRKDPLPRSGHPVDMTPSELLDRPVSEVLALQPAAGRVFLDRGMSCPGCPFSPFETVADVAAVYGVDAITLAAALLDAADVTASGAPL